MSIKYVFNPTTGNLDATDKVAFNGEVNAGSAASPSIFFTGDPNTGIYSPGADQLALSTNGTGRLFVDANGKVGIGASSPNYKLEVAPDANRSFAVDTDGTFSLVLRNTSTNAGADLAFDTKDSLQFKSNGNPKVTILNSGNVGIGTTSPIRLFHALDSANSIVGRVESGQSSSWLQFAASGTGTASRIGDPGGSVNAGLAFMTADTERARIDSSGRLLVGTNAARTLASYGSAGLQVESTAFATASISAVNNQNTADGVALMLGKSRGAAVGSFTVVQSGDQIGGIYFQGADGAAMRSGASVVAVVDAAPAYAATALVNGQTYRIVTVGTTDFTLIGASANTVGTVFTATGPGTGTGTAILNAGNMPGRLMFSTTADGSVSPTERLRITSAGLVGVGTSSPVVDLDVAPAASTATFRIHARSNTTPVAAIELVRGTNTTFGADGNGDYRIKNDTGNLSFEYGDGGVTTERARIDSSGRLLVGTSSSRASFDTNLEIEATGFRAGVAATRNSNDANPAFIYLCKTRATSVSGNTVVADGDNLGQLQFLGADGTAPRLAASILAQVDGPPGANDMPGRLVFSTTADGAASPTERFRITNDGVRGYNQSAPAAVDTTATLTVANLKTGIITSSTAAAVTMTLPTGTLTEGGFAVNSLYNNFTFEWTVINTGGANAVTVQGDTGHTLVGSGTVAAGVSGRFASRRTAANTFVTYRLS